MRWQRMIDLRRYVSRGYWREHLLPVAYGLWAALLFVVFLAGTFPYQETLGAILTPFRLRVSSEDQGMSLPLGADLKDVRLSSIFGSTGAPLLQVSDLTLAPALGSLLLGRPGLNLHADVYEGHLRATVRRHQGEVEVNFDAHDLNLESYRALARIGASLGGLISGTGSLTLGESGLSAGSGSVELSGKGLTLKLGKGLPPIALADCKGTLRLEQGVLKIEQLEGTGPDLNLHASGDITLAPELENSMLDLKLQLEPTASGRARIGLLMGLLPRPPDSEPYELRGPILSPSFS